MQWVRQLLVSIHTHTHTHLIQRRQNLHCRDWRNHVPWRYGQPPLALHWSGLPRCWCRPLQRQSSISALLSGGQVLSISAAGPPWHPWKGGHLTRQSIGPSVPAVPHSSKVKQQPGDERTKPAIKLKHGLHNWAILWPTADTTENNKAKNHSKNKQHTHRPHMPDSLFIPAVNEGRKNIFLNVQSLNHEWKQTAILPKWNYVSIFPLISRPEMVMHDNDIPQACCYNTGQALSKPVQSYWQQGVKGKDEEE